MTDIELEVDVLETAISRLLTEMSGKDCDSDEYAKMVDQLVKLYKAKETHVSLKLKAVETIIKENESDSLIEIKETEARVKEAESAANIRTKEIESQIKRDETDSNCRVKELDAILKQREIDNPWRPSADTLAIIGANIVGIVMILGHERANVIATKALGFVSKLR